MQVQKGIKVKFDSAAGVHLLNYFWIHLWFSYSSRSYSLTLGGGWGGGSLADFKPAKLVFQVFLNPTGRGELGSVCFSFPVVLCLGYNNHSCPIYSPHPLRAMGPTLALSNLHIYTKLKIHLIFATS